MNDFTKEELQYLFDSVDNNCECFKEPDIAYDIRDKIESMIDNYWIDNYCEHEFNRDDWVNDSSGCRWYECKKCGGCYR